MQLANFISLESIQSLQAMILANIYCHVKEGTRQYNCLYKFAFIFYSAWFMLCKIGMVACLYFILDVVGSRKYISQQYKQIFSTSRERNR